MCVKLLTEHHLEFLSLKGGCTGWSETTLIKMPHCWKSHVWLNYKGLTLKAPITTAADDKFRDIFPNLQQK